MRRPGIITGLVREARCLAAPRHGGGPEIRCSGADSGRAAAAAHDLIEEGCRGLVSFGMAGGLDPELRPGDLILPEIIIAPDGARLAADSGWRHELAASLGGQMAFRADPVAGSDGIAATPEAKRALAESTGAVAVDMESHAVARVAAERNIPFLAVRAVADPAHRTLPSAALGAVREDGSLRYGFVLGRLVVRPWQVVSLIRLSRESDLALASLRRVATLGAAVLGLG